MRRSSSGSASAAQSGGAVLSKVVGASGGAAGCLGQQAVYSGRQFTAVGCICAGLGFRMNRVASVGAGPAAMGVLGLRSGLRLAFR